MNRNGFTRGEIFQAYVFGAILDQCLAGDYNGVFIQIRNTGSCFGRIWISFDSHRNVNAEAAGQCDDRR